MTHAPSSHVRPASVAALVFVVLASALGTACGMLGRPAEPSVETTTFDLGIQGRANEHASLAMADETTVAAWASADAERVTDVYAAVSMDGGETFGVPVRVNDRAGDARANGEQPPRIVLVPRGNNAPDIVVFWLARRETGSVLLTARSTDGGKTYGPATLVSGTDVAGNRGWQAIGADRTGAVHMAWLDHRRMAAAAGPAGAAPHRHGAAASPATAAPAAADPVDTVAMAQRSDLYFATGPDDPAPRAITAGVCYCCKTAIAHGPDGTIYLAWRHVYPNNMRDIAFTASRDGGRTFAEPVRVSADGWSIGGCPDDGPSMAVDTTGRVHVVWPTAVTDSKGQQKKGLFHAMTADGRTFSPRVALPNDDHASHPQLTVTGDGALAVVWDEFVGDTPHVFSARGTLDAAGVMTFRRSPAPPQPGRYPVVAAAGANTLTAWVVGQEQETKIRLVRQRIR